MPRLRNTNRLNVRNKVNTKLNALLYFVALEDAFIWPSTVTDSKLENLLQNQRPGWPRYIQFETYE